MLVTMNSDRVLSLVHAHNVQCIPHSVHGMPEAVRQTWERGAPQIYNAVTQP